jgi:hypothetical protein
VQHAVHTESDSSSKLNLFKNRLRYGGQGYVYRESAV